MSGFPLESIQEEAELGDLVSCLLDSTASIHGATPQDMHAYAINYRLLKNSLEAAQLSLIDYAQFATWEVKQEPLEKAMTLADLRSSCNFQFLG